MKKQLWELKKKTERAVRILVGTPRATGMVALSPETAEAEYGAREDVSIHRFVRKRDFVLKPPRHLPEDGEFVSSGFCFPTEIPDYDAVLLESRDPRFTFQHHHLLDDQRRVIYEPHLRFEQLPIRKAFLVECKKLPGTVAYLANTMFCQYGHWLQTQLPLLIAYWEIFGKENIDYYYIGDGKIKDFAEESLLYLGVRKEQIVGCPCRADRSLIAIKTRHKKTGSRLGAGMQLDAFTARFYEENLFRPRPGSGGPSPRKLFVMRGYVTGRRKRNLEEVRAALEPMGFVFTSTQGKTMQEEADLFGNAEVIVAVHGAALHNLLFARPGTTVVEIAPYDYFEESNYVIANHRGCDYWYLIGEPLPEGSPGDSLLQRNRADVIVGVEKLKRLLEIAGVTAGGPAG